ncbi:hypothetical protein IW261DRAFT_1425598 [Armillaria novae-zelandiae]|uniref:Uncharacterized protein n=1 Tax=Armillaria novae-zelandiae TaxID=153914 RepID=A0AA39NSC6_9AGAR|nr:hypothetical protein IW261DRAFT_1425598 [Armillaria novae-zelandiae]
MSSKTQGSISIVLVSEMQDGICDPYSDVQPSVRDVVDSLLAITYSQWYVLTLLLGIDIGRHDEREGYGSNKRILTDEYVGGGGTKPRSGSDRYENQNRVKQKTAIATGLSVWSTLVQVTPQAVVKGELAGEDVDVDELVHEVWHPLDRIATLPRSICMILRQAYDQAIHILFWFIVALAGIVVVAAVFTKETPLVPKVQDEGEGEE